MSNVGLVASEEPSAQDPAASPISEGERRELLRVVRDFATDQIVPRVADYDRQECLPSDLLAGIADLGLFGGVLPPEHGGAGLDWVTFAAVIEEVSKACHVLGTLVSMPSGLVGAGLDRFGTPAQKEQWLAPLARGEIFGAAGVTEPRSGSDVAGITTKYTREGDGFILRGRKAWISNLDIARFFVTFASFDRTLGRRGITAFIVPSDTPGVELRPYKDKLSFRPLCTGDFVLNEVRLLPGHVLGQEGRGFDVAMTAVERGRLGVASRAVGVAQACLDDCVNYANERVVFGQPISNFQLVQSKITDMVIGVETARLLVTKCAEALQRGERARLLTSMAKMYATDVAARTAADAVQIHGAAGVSSEYRVGRMYRDAAALQIVEGPNDLHRALIAEMTLGLRSRGEAAAAST